MELNLNMLFDKLTNFKIKFKNTEYPTPTQVSNKDLVFIVETPSHIENAIQYSILEFDKIKLDHDRDRVEIFLKYQ